MNYLIISYFYAPGATPRALRWSNVAERWAALGHHVDVVCAWEPGLPRDEIRNGVHVYRRSADFLEKLRGYFKRVEPSPPTPLPRVREERGARGGEVKSRLTAPFRWLFQKLYWPDGGFLWYSPALKQAKKLLSQNRYDAIITVSNYFTAHLVGMRSNRQYPDVRWVVDIGDPFSFTDIEPPNNQWLYKQLNRFAERSVFRHADAVTVTTDALRERYAELFAESAEKICVIPPLIAVKSQPSIEGLPHPLAPSPQAERGNKTIRLVYAGRLYADIRRPDYLLKLFAALSDCYPDTHFELHFYGYNRDVLDAFTPYQARLEKQIFLHGTVPHETVIEAMQEANALINIGNKVLYALPSKVVEYASMGKPIINIIHTPQDSSAAFLKPYPAILNLLTDSSVNFEQQVQALYEFVTSPPPVDMQIVRDWLRSFEVDAIGAAYDKVVS